MSGKPTQGRSSTPHAALLPPNAPGMGNNITRFIGSAILRVLGWKLSGNLPNVKKIVFIGAPHSSNWDFILAVSSIMAIGLKCSWMMKREAFFWPLGSLWKKLGGIPIDRSAAKPITEQITDWFNANDTAWLGITPSGTRSKVAAFKTGYLRFAYSASAPVFLVAIDAVNKHVVLDKLWELSGNIESDNAAIKAYYDLNYRGINH